jgi:hypothetical protein
MPRNTAELRKLPCCNGLGRKLPLARLRFALHCLIFVGALRLLWGINREKLRSKTDGWIMNQVTAHNDRLIRPAVATL